MTVASVRHWVAALTTFAVWSCAVFATHLPNALLLFLLVPYRLLNAATPIAVRAATHVRAGFGVAETSAATEARTLDETQLPNAFLPCFPVP